MSSSTQRLSVPAPRKTLPRDLTSDERATLTAIADILCGSRDESVPPPSKCLEYPQMLDLALATRSDSFEEVTAALAGLSSYEGSLEDWLRSAHDESAELFQVVSTVAAGAYLMVPQIREAVGYPGQRRNPPKPEEAVDEISDGILDPVMERGFFYVPTPGQERSA